MRQCVYVRYGSSAVPHLNTGFLDPQEALFMSKQIPLSGKKGRGLFATVDDGDFDYLSQFKWRNAHGYAVRTVKIAPGKYRQLGMHVDIMKPPPGMEVDHEDRVK